jgi:hypothetical protein
MDTLYLYGGYVTEISKRSAIRCTQKAHDTITRVCESWDERHNVVAPCDGSILCERTGVRHKSGCLSSPTYHGSGAVQW